MQTKEEFYKNIEKHLDSKGGLIAVVKGTNKLQKPNANRLKFNWSKADILKEAPSVGVFIESLPSKGFGTGSVLILRKIHGNTTELVKELELTFGETPINNAMGQPQEQIQPSTPESMSSNNPTPQPQPQPQPQPHGLAYAQMPTHEVIDMKVKLMRYEDLLDKLKVAEDELREKKTELELNKIELAKAKQSLETIEEKHSLALERAEQNRKTWIETDTGKEVAGQLAGKLPEILEAFKPRQQQVGMANPLAGLSPAKQQCLSKLQQLPDEAVPLMEATVHSVITIDGFAEELTKMINHVQSQNQE